MTIVSSWKSILKKERKKWHAVIVVFRSRDRAWAARRNELTDNAYLVYDLRWIMRSWLVSPALFELDRARTPVFTAIDLHTGWFFFWRSSRNRRRRVCLTIAGPCPRVTRLTTLPFCRDTNDRHRYIVRNVSRSVANRAQGSFINRGYSLTLPLLNHSFSCLSVLTILWPYLIWKNTILTQFLCIVVK